MFWGLFQATGQLRTVFWTSFSLLTKEANFKQIDSCAIFWRQFRATGQLRTMFWTRFSFFKKVANFKNNDSLSECFDANYEQQDSCGLFFWHVCLLVNKRRQLQEKRQLRRVFWRQFEETGQIRTVYWTSYRLLTKDGKFKQTVLTPVWSNMTVAHGVLDKF